MLDSGEISAIAAADMVYDVLSNLGLGVESHSTPRAAKDELGRVRAYGTIVPDAYSELLYANCSGACRAELVFSYRLHLYLVWILLQHHLLLDDVTIGIIYITHDSNRDRII